MNNSEDTESFTSPVQEPPKSSRKSMVVLVIAAFVLLATSLGLGMMYYFEMTEASSLRRQVEELKVSAAKMDAEMARDEIDKVEVEAPAVKYREIPELGVKYKVIDATKNLTYVYTKNTTNAMATTSFTTMALAELRDSKDNFPCTTMPSGMIIRYEGEGAPKSNSDPRTVVKKVGDHYYFYAAPEVGCMIDTKDAPNFQKSVSAVKAAYDSLEVM